MMTDSQLLERVMDGQTRLYGEVFSRYRRRAYALAFQYLHNGEDAKDVVQDAFVRAFQNLPRFNLNRKFGPWLLAIVRNLSIDLLRKRKNRSEDLPATLPDGRSPSAEKRLLKSEVWQALQSLDHKHREVIFLKDYQGYSYAEIADVLDIPIGTVMSRLHHARKNLAGLLLEKAP